MDIHKLSNKYLKPKGIQKSKYADQEEFDKIKEFFAERNIPRWRIAPLLEVSYQAVLKWWKDGIPQKRFKQLQIAVKEIQKWEEENNKKFE